MTLSHFLKKYLFFIVLIFLVLGVLLFVFGIYKNNTNPVWADKLNEIFPLCFNIYNYTSSVHLTGLFMELRNVNDDIPAAIQVLDKESVKNSEMFSELNSLIIKTAELKNFSENNLTDEVKISVLKLVEILGNHNHLAADYLNFKKQYIELIIKDYEFSLANGTRRFSSPQSEAIFEAENKLRDLSNKLSAVYKQYISAVQELARNAGLVLE